MGASGATMLVVCFNIDRKRASQGCLGNDMLNALCIVQIVLGVLSAWGIGIYTALKVFGGKKEEPAAAH